MSVGERLGRLYAQSSHATKVSPFQRPRINEADGGVSTGLSRESGDGETASRFSPGREGGSGTTCGDSARTGSAQGCFVTSPEARLLEVPSQGSRESMAPSRRRALSMNSRITASRL